MLTSHRYIADGGDSATLQRIVMLFEVPELPPIFGVGAELPPSLGSAGMGSEDYVEEGEGQC